MIVCARERTLHEGGVSLSSAMPYSAATPHDAPLDRAVVFETASAGGDRGSPTEASPRPPAPERRAPVGQGGARATGNQGLGSLSAREREIAELVADGLANREIGARLFLSEKTIETHLTRVFQKLGLRSRTQVAAEIARID